LNKPILWILLPTSESIQTAKVNDFLTKLSPSIIQKVRQHSINLINLADSMKNNMHLRNTDGIHFTPKGHRHITEQIAQMMTNLQIGTSNTSINESALTVNASFMNKTPSRDVRQGVNFNRFNPYYHRHKLRNTKHIKFNNNNGRQKMKLNINEAEKFGIAFGIAWKTYTS
ncbi:unnamed protein product, partial [Rotaria sordida]